MSHSPVQGTYGPYAHLDLVHPHQTLECTYLEAPIQPCTLKIMSVSKDRSNIQTILLNNKQTIYHLFATYGTFPQVLEIMALSNSDIPIQNVESKTTNEYLMHLDPWRMSNSSQILHNLLLDCTQVGLSIQIFLCAKMTQQGSP